MVSKYNHLQTNRGFSLIEIMVVVVIIGIFASASVLMFNPNNTASELRQESLRLQRVISIALDEAQIHASQLGLVITEEGYQFLLLKDQVWQPISDDKPLETHHWPEETKIFLKLEGLAFSDEDERRNQFSLSSSFDNKLERDRETQSAFYEEDSLAFSLEDDEEEKEALKMRPQIYILSSGETTPFELLIMKQDQEQDVYFQITANYVGKIEIDGPFDEEPRGNQ